MHGDLTEAEAQSVLRMIAFDSTSDNPDNYGAAPSRTLTWFVEDEAGTTTGSNRVSTTVNITPVNDPATPQPDSFNTSTSAAIGSGLNLFSNNGEGADHDPDNLSFSIAQVNGSAANVGHQFTLPSGALLTVNADGTFAYDPNHAFDSLASGAFTNDSFTYGLSDGGLTTTVTITIDNTGGTTATYNGTAGDDIIHGSNAGDLFDMTAGGNDAVFGGSGNDGFKFGANYTPSDRIDGGGGTNNQIQLDGDYSGGVTLGGSSITNVQVMALMPGHNYTISTTDDLAPAGKSFIFWAASMASANHVSIDAQLDAGGNCQFYLGAGNDTAIGGSGLDYFYGGDGQDTLTGLNTQGGGAGVNETDIFDYRAVSNSTSSTYDIITDFLSGVDKIDLPFTVTGINGRVNTGTLSTASFDTDLAAAIGAGQLGANHAVIFAPNAGDLTVHAFLIVDANGVAGYQAGQDYVFDIGGTTFNSVFQTVISLNDFI